MWAIVTGGSSGLGKAIATRLAKDGYDVVIVSRSAEKLQSAADGIMAACPGREVVCLPLDLSLSDAPRRLFDWAADKGIHPTVLVNDAGMYIYKPATAISESERESLVNLNINTLSGLCSLFGEMMEKDARQEGYAGVKKTPRHIVNIASYSVYMPIWGFSMYAGSKAFVRTFSRCIGKEMRPFGVYVTAVAPAGIDTGLMKLRPTVQKLASRLGFLAGADTVARIGLRAAKHRRRYCIPLWYNVLFIPFLWMFQPLFKKVL